MLATLNHPGIAHVYGFESATLGDGSIVRSWRWSSWRAKTSPLRLQARAVPLDEALAIARQIAEALEAAHEKGIVHRDLKPANVKITPDGKVKVLDFGLAKAWSGEDSGGTSSPDLSRSPTLAQAGTAAGLILGTAAYMSPEQARGKPVDKKADIWAFGVVLYEMLTGRRLFEGETRHRRPGGGPEDGARPGRPPRRRPAAGSAAPRALPAEGPEAAAARHRRRAHRSDRGGGKGAGRLRGRSAAAGERSRPLDSGGAGGRGRGGVDAPGWTPGPRPRARAESGGPSSLRNGVVGSDRHLARRAADRLHGGRRRQPRAALRPESRRPRAEGPPRHRGRGGALLLARRAARSASSPAES